MLEKFLELLERFVVAHEMIAANMAKQAVVAETATIEPAAAKEETKEVPVEGEDIVDTKPAKEDKPKRKPRKAKVEEQLPLPEPEPGPEPEPKPEPKPEPEEEKAEVDYQSLRDQIQAIDDAISSGPSDDACDDADDLLEEFTGKKMKITAIKDEDLAEYLERLTAIKNKYFEEE